MGAQLDRLRYEVFQNLFYSPMNTGILRAAVATAPTVYGIETSDVTSSTSQIFTLQQHLPFTVLKRIGTETLPSIELVATAPTVYGIETEYLFSIHLDEEYRCNSAYRSRY